MMGNTKNKIFAEKTVANSHKTTKFTNVFSLKSFLLFGSTYVNTQQQLICSLIGKLLCKYRLHVHVVECYNHCSTQQDKFLCY